MANEDNNQSTSTQKEELSALIRELVRTSISAAQQAQNDIHQSDITSEHVSVDTKLPLPKKYNGERDVSTIENFIFKIEKLRKIKKWTQEGTYDIAYTLLDGRAADWINHLEKKPETRPTTWAELKIIIEDKFKPANSEDLARDLLWNTVQKTSIQSYVDSFMDVSILVPDIGDKDLVDRFIHGLKEAELIAKLRSIRIDERTLEVVLQTSLAYEAAHNPTIAQATFNRITAAQTVRDDPMDLDAISYRRSSPPQRRFNSNRGGYNNSYNRGGYNNNYNRGGSFSRNSNANYRSRDNRSSSRAPTDNRTCYQCQQPGHIKRDCPEFTAAIVQQVIRAMNRQSPRNGSRNSGSVNAIDANTYDDVDPSSSHINYNNNKDDDRAHAYDAYLQNSPPHSEKDLRSSDDLLRTTNDDTHTATQSAEPHVSSTHYVHNSDNTISPSQTTVTPSPVELVPIIADLTDHSMDVPSHNTTLHKDVAYLAQLNASIGSSSLPLYRGTVFSSHRNTPIAIRILIDTGASENYIAPRIANIIHGDRVPVRGREVETAGGNISPIKEKLTFELDLQGHVSLLDAFIFDTKFDVILGRSWLKKHKPIPDWFDDTWKLNCCCTHLGCSDVTIVPLTGADKHEPNDVPQLNYLISHLRAENMLKEEGTEACFLYLVDDSKQINNTSLQNNERWVNQLVADFPDVFQNKLPGLPPERPGFAHVINVDPSVKPINRPPFRMSPAELDELQKQLQELLSLGLIRPSTSPWGAPVLFVKKKDGTMRMCIDYRALNKVTIRNTSPLPRIDECLDRLQGASYFTSLDLKSGYHQIRVQDSDVSKTAFNTRYGKYEFLVLPFGLSNAPPSFQSWMNQILDGCIDKFVLIYLDDALIFSRTKEDHIKHVREVLSRFNKEKLVVNLKKCEFGKRELEFLGYRVSESGILPSESKIKAISKWQRPTNVQEVRQFLGLAQHYRRFCPRFSTIAAPLTELTHGTGAKKRPVTWSANCEKSFQAVKDMLTSPPLLRLPDLSKPFRIETDASDFGVGAVLLQSDQLTGHWVPIAYESKKLSPAEQKFPAQERELIAIIHALNTWRCFIDGCTAGYTVFCDHKPLIYYQSQIKPTPRLVRWMAMYELYNPHVEYKPGKENDVADALSRIPNLLDPSQPDVPSLTPDYLYATWDQLSHELRMDWPLLYINDKHRSVDSSTLRDHLEKEESNFTVQDNQVFRKYITEKGNESLVRFIPFNERADLVFQYHESFGHAGVKTMLKMFGDRFWWPTMKTDIKDWIRTCAQCQLNSNHTKTHQDVMHPLSIPKAFERWHLDFVGELPVTKRGNKWLLTAVDSLTNWPIARAVPVASKEAVADFIYEEIVMRFGCPTEIITDRGANFTSGLVQEYVKRIGTNHKLTSAFHPRTNSKVERYNGVIKQMLRKYVNGAIHKWDKFVNAALWASRIRVHSTTGFSPFYLVYGREPKLPGDVLQPYATQDIGDAQNLADLTQPGIQLLAKHRTEAEVRLRAVGERDKQTWDSKIKQVQFESGDLVMLTHEGKFGLEPRFKGPYIVKQSFPEYGTYQLETVTGETIKSLVHVDRLKSAKGTQPPTPWYDPTASRREVREANRQLDNNQPPQSESIKTSMPSVDATNSQQILPSAITVEQPNKDDIITQESTEESLPITNVSPDTSVAPQNPVSQAISEQVSTDARTTTLSANTGGPLLPSLTPLSNGLLPLPIPTSTIKAVNQTRRAAKLVELPLPQEQISDSQEQISDFTNQNQPPPDFVDPVGTPISPELPTKADLSTPTLDQSSSAHDNTDGEAALQDDPHSVTSSVSNDMDTNEPMFDPSDAEADAPTDNQDDETYFSAGEYAPTSTALVPVPTSTELVADPVSTTSTAVPQPDVQRRTSVSKGGNVDAKRYGSSEYDLEERIMNWNKNKKRRFKPVVPERNANKKQRLLNIRQIVYNILNIKNK